jgi:Ca2+-binding EF-hand superfamily protein
LFDTEGTGKVDPRELKAAMQSLGFDQKNPTIFNMIAELENEGYSFTINHFQSPEIDFE